jgi:hypothetical protein
MIPRIAPKVLLIGWDAADWDLIRPLMAAGHMPHLSRLITGGASGYLASLEPMLSPMLWTSIVTGKHPHKHGVHGFTEPSPDGSGIRPVSSASRTAQALWNILTQAGLRAHQVGWYATHPAEPISGVSISNYLSVAPPPGSPWPLAEGTIHPAALAADLAPLRLRPEEVGLDELRHFIPHAARLASLTDDRLLKCRVILAETATTHAAGTWVLEQHPWEFAAILYDGIDHFGHMFMECHPPKLPWVSHSDFDDYQHVMATAYRFHDLMLGRLLQLAREDTVVILVSDHGFRCGDDRSRDTIKSLEGLSHWHRPNGVVVMHGPGVRAGVRLERASLLDVAPTILFLLGLPIGQDMDGCPWLEVLETTKPPQTIASWEQTLGEVGGPPEAHPTPADALQVLRHLINLGYLTAPGADVQQAIDETIDTNQFNLARALLFARLPERAIELLASLIAKHPANEEFRAALAKAQTSAGDEFPVTRKKANP